jgi:hypothetical protein
MNLSPSFALEEFTRSQTAARMGRDIIAEPDVVDALRDLCRFVLQPLRDSIGVTIAVSSGYRPAWLNPLIGGSPTSQHMFGRAADINAVGYTPMALCQKIIDLDLPFDQVICEFDQWAHVSYSEHQRSSVLTARKIGGATVYLKGLVPK